MMKQVIILDNLEDKDLEVEINKMLAYIETSSSRPHKVNDIKFIESFDELLVMFVYECNCDVKQGRIEDLV